MNVLIFGATGMVGQGVLRECLLDPGVQLVQVIVRTSTECSTRRCARLCARICGSIRTSKPGFRGRHGDVIGHARVGFLRHTR
jgi:dihydrodipicolinate reductase